tara:strand:+ start:385 stop:1428 length:1044 start_codon:yes stop_codon:yes gene_type:complete
MDFFISKNEKNKEIRVLFNKANPTWGCFIDPIRAYFNHFGYHIIPITPEQVMSQELTKTAYDIVVMSFFGSSLPNIYLIDKPIIYISGERYRVKPIIRTGPAIHMMASRSPEDLIQCNIEGSEAIYTPYICTKVITQKTFTNGNQSRPYWLAYCASNPQEHREQAFSVFVLVANSIKGNGSLCRSLGKCDGGYPQNNFPVAGNHSSQELAAELSKYRYMWCAENADVEGYITEKIMLAYNSGCIPVYWGTIDIKKYFNPASFIYVNDFASIQACAEYIFSLKHKAADKMRNAPIYLDSTNNIPTNEVPPELSLKNLCKGNTGAFEKWINRLNIKSRRGLFGTCFPSI